MPKVSVIMPTYNNADLITAAIESVLRQSFLDFELLVINDGSTDRTDQVIKEIAFKDDRVRYINNTQNLGLIRTLNLGLDEAKGEYIARLDSDDEWVDKKKLEKQVNFINGNTEVGLVGTLGEAVDYKGNILFNLIYPVTDIDIRKNILLKNCFIHSSVLFRKDLAIQCGGYDDDEKYVEDYGLWLRMGKIMKFANIPDYSVGYRVNEVGETQKNNSEQINNALKLIPKFRNDYPNFFIGLIKWNTRLLIGKLFGSKLYWKFKKIFLGV